VPSQDTDSSGAQSAGPLITDLMGLALPTVAGLQVVGRGEAYRCRWLLSAGAPAEHLPPWHGTAVLLLPPNLPQYLQSGELPHTESRVRSPHPFQESIAVRANLTGERPALARVL
jgi:hypothetical protein